MRLGFIGTGVITSAMVTGFCKADLTALHILVSPRNAEKAAALATAFPSVEVARDNQDVVDRCDLVVLAVISQVARETIGTLQFRADQRVISLMALFSLSEVEDLVDPATRVCRVVPLPPVARGKCPIVQCPPDSEVRDLLSRIGTVIEVSLEVPGLSVCQVLTKSAEDRYSIRYPHTIGFVMPTSFQPPPVFHTI